ncbi:MAG: carboxypeptidase-like regulatory domain-containing protein [bacterium]|nr:carboxypeptidase-like regulatory domain-containing protein [bacterium]
MKNNIAYFTAIFLLISTPSFSKALIGEITKQDYKVQRPQVVDGETGMPLKDAVVSVPTEGKVDFTDENGFFKITPNSGKPVILSVQKEGYRPFSLTLQDGTLRGGVIFELKKSSPFELILSDNLLHLGDNSYSPNSSGACLINSPCVGPSFTKDFRVDNVTNKTKAYVEIGSVIGIDTIQAMKLGQNKLTNAYSTPVEFFVNKTKIGELKINGDNQKIPIPLKLLKANSSNTLTIKTGENKDAFVTDYDDIEIMNLVVDIRD